MVVVESEEESYLDLADEIEIRLQHWLRTEKAVFKSQSSVTGGVQDTRQLPAEVRVRAVQFLRTLVQQHSAEDAWPAVVTAFDALGAMALSGGGGFDEENAEPQNTHDLSLGTLTCPMTLAAVVNVVLKSGFCSITFSGKCRAEAYLQAYMKALGDEDDFQPSLVKYREAIVVKVLDGRTRSASPQEWASQILDRLNAMAQPADRLSWALENSVLPSIKQWADVFTERVAATVALPPHALAVGACVLGLTEAGLLSPAEVCPSDLSAEEWEESFLVVLERSRPEGAQEEAQFRRLTLRELAEAAMCDDENFCHDAFGAVAALQVVLTKVTHPPIISATL